MVTREAEPAGAQEPRPPRRDIKLPKVSFRIGLFAAYLAIVLGIFTFYVPPFQKSDELAHFYRAVSLTNFDLRCSTDEDGERYYPMTRKYADVESVFHVWDVAMQYGQKYNRAWHNVDFSDPRFDEMSRVAFPCDFTPLGYPANVVGVLIGKPFTNPLTSLYLGRAAGAVFFVGMLIWGFKVTPQRYRPLLFLYAALPATLHQVTTISYDAVQLSLLPPIFGYWARFMAEDGPIRRRDLLVFLGLTIWMVNVRLVAFMPMVLLFFVIDWRKVARSSTEYLRIAAGFVGAAVALMLVLTFSYYPKEDKEPGEVVYSSFDQLDFVLGDLTRFPSAIYETFRLQLQLLFGQGIAGFGWQDYGLDYFTFYIFLFGASCVLFSIYRQQRLALGKLQLLALWGSILGTIMGLFMAAYFFWTPVGQDYIHGLQGRYFLVLLPFFLIACVQLVTMVGKDRMINALLLFGALVVLRNIYRAVDLRYFG